MICPYCKHSETKVIDSREVPDAEEIRRRRECIKCEKRFTTKERVEGMDLVVIKKSGEQEDFDIDKLRKSFIIACKKRPVTKEQIEDAIARVESKVRKLVSTEVPSKFIGEQVMKELKKLDKVAYVRYASVYKEFKDLEEFEEELGRLMNRPMALTT